MLADSSAAQPIFAREEKDNASPTLKSSASCVLVSTPIVITHFTIRMYINVALYKLSGTTTRVGLKLGV